MTARVPLGDYELKWAFGTHWYGYKHENHFFGPDTSAQVAGQSVSFSRDGNVVRGKMVTLYVVPGGTLETHAIPIDEF